MPRTSTRRRREAAEYSKSIRNLKPSPISPSTTTTTEIDLSVVDKAYGDYADLYGDVLRVGLTTTQEHIQLAYFDRRSELFTLLAKIDAKSQNKGTDVERRQAERKMDSVVLAVRILGDPASREKYDQLRQVRMLNRRRSKQNHFDGDYSKVSRRATFQDSPVTQSYSDTREKSTSGSRTRGKLSLSRALNKNARRGAVNLDDTINTQEMTDEEAERDFDRSYVSHEAEEFRQDDTTIGSGTIGTMTIGETTIGSGTIGSGTIGSGTIGSGTIGTATIGDTTFGDATYDTYTVITMDDERSEVVLPFCGSSQIAKKISREFTGAFQDTVTSFDQVFNAFTLTDKDIRAVTKRIDKVKRQLDD